MARKKPTGRRRQTRATVAFPQHEFQPEDILNFIELVPFTRRWKHLGLDVECDLAALQMMIMAKPDVGSVLPGSGGLRKLRFAPDRWSSGKSGAARVLYVHFKEFGVVLLCVVYGKNEVGTISDAVKSFLRKTIKETKDELERRQAIRLGKELG